MGPDKLWPGAALTADGPSLPAGTSPPEYSASPLSNFSAQETANADLLQAIINEPFSDLPLRDAERITIRVERLREIGQPDEKVERWL